MELLVYQWTDGIFFQIASILVGLVIIFPIFFLSRLGKENVAAYIAMSVFLGIFATMVIVGAIIKDLLVTSLGGLLGTIVGIFFIIFHTKWKDE